MKRLPFWTAALLLASVPASVLAHGLEMAVQAAPPFAVAKVVYEGLKTEPAARCEIQVFAPGEESPYQTGITDRQGEFVFRPTQPGQWRLVAEDGMGHRAQAFFAHLDSGPQATPPPEAANPARSEQGGWLWRAATGISLLLAAGGWLAYFNARKGRPAG